VTRHPRRTVTHNFASYARPQSIGSNKYRANDPFSGVQQGIHFGTILLVANDMAAGSQVNRWVCPTCAYENPVEIAAMGYRVGITVSLTEWSTQVNLRNVFGGHSIDKDQLIDKHGHLSSFIADAEVIKGMESIWTKL
jgi:hypothetical protein